MNKYHVLKLNIDENPRNDSCKGPLEISFFPVLNTSAVYDSFWSPFIKGIRKCAFKIVRFIVEVCKQRNNVPNCVKVCCKSYCLQLTLS